jgi:hypothetical protein
MEFFCIVAKKLHPRLPNRKKLYLDAKKVNIDVIFYIYIFYENIYNIYKKYARKFI